MKHVFLLLCIIISLKLYAHNWTFTPSDPEGGWVIKVVSDSSSTNIAVAINPLSGWRTIDATNWWEIDDLKYSFPEDVVAVGYGKFVLVNNDQIMLSTDYGISWSVVDYFNNICAISENYGDTIYLADDTLLYRSTNGGEEWHFVSSLPYEVTCIAYAPSDPDIIYVGTVHEIEDREITFLYKSTDGGFTWTSVFAETDTAEVDRIVDIEVSPQNPNHVFICFGIEQGPTMNLLYSSDGGLDWIPTALETPALILPNDVEFISEDTILVASIFVPGIFMGVWDGTAWHYTKVDSSANFLQIESYGNVIYASSCRGVFISTDRGFTWSPINSGMKSALVFGEKTVSNAVESTVMYSEFFGGSIYITNDGTSWFESFVPEIVFSEAKAIYKGDPDIAYLSSIGVTIENETTWTFHNIYKTTDGGLTWFPMDIVNVSPDSLSPFSELWVSPTDPNLLLSVNEIPHTDTNVVQRSTDGGQTWTPVLYDVMGFLFGSDTVFVMKHNTLYVSYDKGQNWEPLIPLYSPYDIVYDPAHACIYVASWSMVEKIDISDLSRDTVIISPQGYWYDVAIDVADNGVLYGTYSDPMTGVSYFFRKPYLSSTYELDTLDFVTAPVVRALSDAVLVGNWGYSFMYSEDAFYSVSESYTVFPVLSVRHNTLMDGTLNLTLNTNSDMELTLCIYDIAGRKIFEKPLKAHRGLNRFTIEKCLPSGIFLLMLRDGKGIVYSGKVINLRRNR